MSRGDRGDCRARGRGGLQSPDSVVRTVEKQGGQAGVQAEGPASRLACGGVPRSRRALEVERGGAGRGWWAPLRAGDSGLGEATGRYTLSSA